MHEAAQDLGGVAHESWRSEVASRWRCLRARGQAAHRLRGSGRARWSRRLAGGAGRGRDRRALLRTRAAGLVHGKVVSGSRRWQLSRWRHGLDCPSCSRPQLQTEDPPVAASPSRLARGTATPGPNVLVPELPPRIRLRSRCRQSGGLGRRHPGRRAGLVRRRLDPPADQARGRRPADGYVSPLTGAVCGLRTSAMISAGCRRSAIWPDKPAESAKMASTASTVKAGRVASPL